MFGQGYSHWVGGFGHPDREGGRGGHGFGRGGPEGRHGRGGGRRRLFDGGELKLVLLSLIAEQERHGYDLIRAIEERTGGAYAPSPGVVYPTLTLLVDMGHIEERETGGQRRLFGISEAGSAFLAEKGAEVAELFARIDALGQHSARTDVAPIKRAVGNLRQVLQHKLGEDKLDRDKLHEIVALIDEAAARIERL
ncbi:PadR family transcriptional regulator [Sphingomonas naphthae]|uniref:PadR family transcriptional regulator n=1 Tax=Sphingomonas naphthae TaxID=1813468 RepID=A0ABY7TFY4_9SPHN|nr:PadR family transcriptional regulator [Sphingomonas naphthae]WCT72142.1 PadR family transcriptional regulator [Sphingomonas naphthae]